MKKLLVVGIVCLAFTFALGGCKKKEEVAPEVTQEVTVAPTEDMNAADVDATVAPPAEQPAN